MRKVIILFSVIIYSLTVSSQNLKMNINYLLFSFPKDRNYVEFQCLTLGNSIHYSLIDSNKYQGTIYINIKFTPLNQPDSSFEKKYSFITQKYSDSILSTKENIYNVIRIPLSNGEYSMKIKIYDAAMEDKTSLNFEENIFMDYNREDINISDIQLISTLEINEEASWFSKHNIDFIPYFSTYYPERITKLVFMSEIYNTDIGIWAKDSFKYRCYISDYEKDKPITDKYLREKTCKKTDLYLILHSFDIDSLASGNYFLTIGVYSLKDSLITSKKMFFQRSNPPIDILQQSLNPNENIQIPLDTLYLYLDYIYVIANDDEKKYIREAKTHNYKELDEFFASFWTKRYPNDPLKAWYEYYKNVMIVNNSYTSLTIKGYKTDRGYVFLKYGAPSEIEKYPFTNEYYPYEIWYYYNVGNQNNIYFIFYSRDLATNMYELIHSTARDELYDPRWKLILKAKDARSPDIEATE